MSFSLTDLVIPPWVPYAAVAAVCLAIFIGGWHYGEVHIQTAWDASVVASKAAADKSRANDQKLADALGTAVETQLAIRDNVIKNLAQELTNATDQLGACGHQPIPPDGVQLYSHAAATR